MSASQPLLIHVGYHKTGTTWLQRVLFKPQYGYNPLMEHEEIFATFLRPHALDYDSDAARERVDGLRGQGGAGSVDLISSEILCGNPFYGGRESELYAQRLKAAAPDARILITIREQGRSLTSIYMQYLSRAGTLKPKAFFADDPVMGYFAFAPEHLEYHRLVRLYGELFGLENVCVMTQEALARDGRGFARDLAAFAGVTATGDLDAMSVEPVSPSPPEFAAGLVRFVNHFRSGPMGPGPMLDLGRLGMLAYRAVSAIGRREPARSLFRNAKPVTDYVQSRFAGRYAESNRQLKALLGDRIDLPKYEM